MGGVRGVTAVFLLLVTFEIAHAQDLQDKMWGHLKEMRLGPLTLDLGGQVRFRYEYDKEFSVKSYDPGTTDHFLLERVILDADLRYGERGRIYLQLRDAHVMGSRLDEEDFPQSNPFEDHVDMRQGFFEWLRIGGSPLGVKVGRQQISYGDQRVFGPGLWGNTGRYAWDAVMLKADTEYFWSDVWVGRFIKNDPDEWPNSAFAWPVAAVVYSHVRKLPFRLECFYALKYDGSETTKGERGTGDLVSHSIGFQLEGERKPLEYGATFVHQFGGVGRDTLRAFGANGKAGLTLPVPWEPQIVAQFTWGSGDSDLHDGVHGTFDGVFGGADILFYGYLNLFAWANIRDHEFDLLLKPADVVTIKVQYHYFSLDQAKDAWYTTSIKPLRRDTSGNAGTSLGHEVDTSVIWEALKYLQLTASYGHFFPGAFCAATGGAPDADWVCGQVVYSF